MNMGSKKEKKGKKILGVFCGVRESFFWRKGDCSPRRDVGTQDDENKGFTLIEVLFAIGAMTLFLVGMTALLVKSLSSTEISKNRSQAAIYLQEGVEHARQCRDQADSWDDFVIDGCGELEDPLPSFETSLIISDLDPKDTNRKKITIEVTWTDGKGDHVITTDTILSKW